MSPVFIGVPSGPFDVHTDRQCSLIDISDGRFP
jgi:hypothetical protein